MDMSSEVGWESGGSRSEGVAETAVGVTLETARDTDADNRPIDLYISFCFDDVDSTEILTGDIILTNIPRGATLNIGKAGSDYTWIISQDHLEVTELNGAGNAVGWEIPSLTMNHNEQNVAFYMLGMQVTVLDGEQIKEFTNNIKVLR